MTPPCGTQYRSQICLALRHQGNQWEYASVTFTSHYKQYTAVLEAVTNDASNSNAIAVDDVEFLSGECPPKGNCDFENGLCGWTNVRDGGEFSVFYLIFKILLCLLSVPMFQLLFS